MKKSFLIFLTFFLLFSSQAHDFNIGRFNLTEDDNEWRVQIQVDADNVQKALMAHCPDSFQKLDFNKQLSYYLIDNFGIEVNHRQLTFDLYCFEQKNGFYYVSGHLLQRLPAQGSVSVQNTCLLNIIEDQSNILTISRTDQHRSFRLHKKRQTTNFELVP